ncbi:MAG: biopolymer transporter ExbD [Bacteroidia bacterium]
MSEVQSGGDDGGKKGKHSKLRAKKSSTHIDMTPMVDLAFLLLTFFMLTTTFSKPKTMEINMPVKPPPGTEIPKINNAITVILTDKDRIFWYDGEFKPDSSKLQLSSFAPDGIRKIFIERNKDVIEKVNVQQKRLERREINDSTFKVMRMEIRGDKKALTVLVKTDDKAKYRNVVDLLDELNITNIDKKAIVDISQPEFDLLKKTKGE